MKTKIRYECINPKCKNKAVVKEEEKKEPNTQSIQLFCSSCILLPLNKRIKLLSDYNKN